MRRTGIPPPRPTHQPNPDKLSPSAGGPTVDKPALSLPPGTVSAGSKIKGAPVHAALTFADPAHGGAPGDLVFEIHSVEIAGKRVPLFGGETLAGVKGTLGSKNAKIKPGMTAMAFVAADTVVK